MSAPRIILDYLPCFCQKLSRVGGDFTKLRQNNFACFFETRCSKYIIYNFYRSQDTIMQCSS